MKKLYEKNELTFALVWIGIYCVLQSLANPLNEIIGSKSAVSAVFCVVQAIVLFSFMCKLKRKRREGPTPRAFSRLGRQNLLLRYYDVGDGP